MMKVIGMNNKVVKNATWIITCKVIEAVLHLVITMLTARYLGPSNYGVISYAASIVAFAVPVMQLGVRNILINELVNAPDKKGLTLGTALCMNFVSSLLCIVGVTAFALIANHNETEAIIVCFLYSISLIFQAIQILQYWFQERLLSKYVSLSMLVAYLIVSVYQIILLILDKNIYWFAIAEAIKHAFIAFLLIIIYRKCGGEKLSVSIDVCKRLLSRSKHYILSNLMITIFAQTDKIMLKQMVGDTVTGYYSAAVNCANMSNFVFLAIVDSARPSIFQSKLVSKKSFEQKISLLYTVIIAVSLLQCVGFTVFAKLIVQILYGAEYMPAVVLLQIVVWYTTFAHLGLVRDIWILSEEKQNYLWKINIFGALTNVVLNWLLIPKFGGVGAAVASLITQFIANIGMCFVLKPLRYNNVLMIRGLDPKNLYDLLFARRKYNGKSK